MEMLEAIKGRRTVHDYTAEPVTRAQVEQLLEAAVWAPNHRLTQPWEFYAVSGGAKEKLARLRGELKRAKQADPGSEHAQAVYEKACRELATVPYAVLVCQVLAEDPKVQEEDHLAIGAAVQNMLLTAHSLGLGTFWGSGALVNHPETFAALGVPAGRKGIGLIFVGHAAHEQKIPPRKPAAEKTHWVE
jgi:nitroreductase